MRPLWLPLAVFFVVAVIALAVLELVFSAIELALNEGLGIIVVDRSDTPLRFVTALLIWWRLWVVIVRGGPFIAGRWVRTIAGAAILLLIASTAFVAILAISQANPSADQLEAQAIAAYAMPGLTNVRAPSGPVIVNANGHGYWAHYLKATPTCGPNGTDTFQLEWILTDLGWKHQILCGPRVLLDSSSPDGNPPLLDRLRNAFQR
jgi:hypothetical protein